MELESKNPITIAMEEADISTTFDKSESIDLMTDCHNQMEGTVIIYDNDAHGEAIVNVVTNSDSQNDLPLKDCDFMNNMITLHASTSDMKDDECKVDVNTENLENLQNDTAINDTTINDTAINDTVINDTAINDTVINDTAIKSQGPEHESDDDETIATFVTSTGQQLALYAVEDSDEIFAVALYDESGEPPSNFHFLLKADVERLIGEGAVKTVKKPQLQQKKDYKPSEKKEEIIYETFEETKRRLSNTGIQQKPEVKMNIVEVPKQQTVQKTKVKKVDKTNTFVIKSTDDKKSTRQPSSAKTTKKINSTSQSRFNPKKQSNINYITYPTESYIIEQIQDDIDSDAEIIEQSTVQYMLCDSDYSDSELTFDELQASLQSFNNSKATLYGKKTKSLQSQNAERKKDINMKYSSMKKKQIIIPANTQKRETVTICRTYKNPKKQANLYKVEKKVIQEIVEDPTLSDFSTFEDGPNSSDEMPQNEIQNTIIENSLNTVKVKRSRKQQLTMVNRTDSEIIIQPASAFSEEEEEPVVTKKRGRRKKKLLPDPDYNPRKPSRRTRRTHRSVEVIEIDVDENDRASIMEITLDGKKGKGSSDKENDIISVGDSDETDDDSNKKSKESIMQCSHCNRNFRKRRALERHLEICPKLPANIQKMEEKKMRMVGKGKKFKCKSCNEFFDIAVALARHVRAVHSPRKRGRPAKNSWFRDDSDSSDVEDSINESSSEPEREPRKRGRPRIKSLSKDESPTPEIELKLDSSFETFAEPRKRGRPPKKKLSKDRSSSPELLEKTTANSGELGMQSAEQSTIDLSSSEPRKRGRPSKKSLSKEERSITPDLREKYESISAETFAQVPKKRGRPSKRNLSKDERSTTPEIVEKNDGFTDTSTEARKRARIVKTSSANKDQRSESPEVIVKIEVLTESNSNEDEISPGLDDNIQSSADLTFEPERTLNTLNEDMPVIGEKSVTSDSEKNIDNYVKLSSDVKKKSKLGNEKSSRECVSDDLVDVEIKVENPAEPIVESQKSRQTKDRTDERSVSPPAVEEKEKQCSQNLLTEDKDKVKIKKKILSPNRLWKVKKLNCADCGKWFSSAAALATHRLQHRTKTSGLVAHRCQFCKKLIPLELFTKHLTMVHRKSMPDNSGSGSRRAIKRQWATRMLRSSN